MSFGVIAAMARDFKNKARMQANIDRREARILARIAAGPARNTRVSAGLAARLRQPIPGSPGASAAPAQAITLISVYVFVLPHSH